MEISVIIIQMTRLYTRFYLRSWTLLSNFASHRYRRENKHVSFSLAKRSPLPMRRWSEGHFADDLMGWCACEAVTDETIGKRVERFRKWQIARLKAQGRHFERSIN